MLPRLRANGSVATFEARSRGGISAFFCFEMRDEPAKWLNLSGNIDRKYMGFDHSNARKFTVGVLQFSLQQLFFANLVEDISFVLGWGFFENNVNRGTIIWVYCKKQPWDRCASNLHNLALERHCCRWASPFKQCFLLPSEMTGRVCCGNGANTHSIPSCMLLHAGLYPGN